MLAYGDPDGHGVYGQLTYTDNGERVICHECGTEKRALGTHAWYAHQITAAEYRERHGLSVRRGLAAPATTARFAANGRKEPALRALAENRDPNRARAANRRNGQQRAQTMAIRRETGGRSRLGRSLTPGEVKRLAGAKSIAAWAAIAWTLIADGASQRSIARSTGVNPATVHQRVTRFSPPR
ncbi:MucR family transcriptional regulator [Streptosporangium sp. NPDC048047]|uniref:MucR family transcriptional regulator n=1 Tax=Streptosporangium sp. NPDC048047 TaxID=3155748 RepID=UPI003423B8DD